VVSDEKPHTQGLYLLSVNFPVFASRNKGDFWFAFFFPSEQEIRLNNHVTH
jgi:hypothetical protein